MANTQRPELSAVFTDMLAQNKKRFDQLYGGGPAAGSRGPGGSGATAVPSPPLPASGRLGPDTPARRRLNERFGADWRYEIVEQRRDGDEAIVLCKLIFAKTGAIRTQFGRAKISQEPVAGTSGDVRFSMGTASAQQDERDAIRRATEAALMNCIDLI